MANADPFDTAIALHEAGRLAEAEALCRQIVAADSRHSGALLLLGMVRAQSGDPAEALMLIRRSLGIAPDLPLAHFHQALVLAGLGRTAEALQSYRRATELAPDFLEAYYNSGHLLLAMNRPEEALAAFEHSIAPMPDLAEARCARAAVLTRLNRREEALAELDGVLARRPDFTPALNMRSELYRELGRPADSLAEADRSLALDAKQAPAHAGRGSTLIALHRLPEALEALNRALALDPNSTKALAMRAEAGLPERDFVFCSFNAGYKITPEMFDIWTRLLRDAEGSVLWLLAENLTMRRHLRAEAKARGVAPERLVFADRLPRARYLARLALADCFLDSLPCNAHTTASDALWMGVPLITCLGRSFAARVAGSMLTSIGMDELIARDLHDYEAMALELARSPERLAALRGKLARNRSSHPLFDMARLARHVERAYEMMWRRHGEGRRPAGFDVPPAG